MAEKKKADTHCTPKSPVLKTSIRFRPKQANISTLHLPSPRTAVSFSSTSSSLASMSILALSSPDANFSARPCTYSALRWDRPAVRSVSMDVAATDAGGGKPDGVGGKRSMNFFLIDAAAAPET
jgi:hypothetical protein